MIFSGLGKYVFLFISKNLHILKENEAEFMYINLNTLIIVNQKAPDFYDYKFEANEKNLIHARL